LGKTIAMPKAKKATPKKAVKKAVPKKTAKPVVKKVKEVKAVKKAAPAKAKEKTIHIKYDDKSAGQPELIPIFESIKKMLMPYAGKREMLLHMATYGQANLVSHKAVEIAGRKRDDLWFASALIQKGYVGFYFIGVNMDSPLRKKIHPDLMKCLKGKACFHVKTNDPAMMKHINEALKLGYDAFVKMGWI
jgi:hypothetical protein